MEALHHDRKVFSNRVVPKIVVMVAHERSNPWLEPELLRVLLELIPENLLRFFTREGVKLVPTARSDEVALVATVPMLEAVLIEILLARGCVGLARVHE